MSRPSESRTDRKTALTTFAGILAIVTAVVVVQTTPIAAVLAFASAALAFGAVALRDKK